MQSEGCAELLISSHCRPAKWLEKSLFSTSVCQSFWVPGARRGLIFSAVLKVTSFLSINHITFMVRKRNWSMCDIQILHVKIPFCNNKMYQVTYLEAIHLAITYTYRLASASTSLHILSSQRWPCEAGYLSGVLIGFFTPQVDRGRTEFSEGINSCPHGSLYQEKCPLFKKDHCHEAIGSSWIILGSKEQWAREQTTVWSDSCRSGICGIGLDLRIYSFLSRKMPGKEGEDVRQWC